MNEVERESRTGLEFDVTNDSKTATETVVAFLGARLDEQEADGRSLDYLQTGEFLLADAAAKRKVVRRCDRIWAEYESGGPLAGLVRAVDASLILHDLAEAYSDHPDYPRDPRG